MFFQFKDPLQDDAISAGENYPTIVIEVGIHECHFDNNGSFIIHANRDDDPRFAFMRITALEMKLVLEEVDKFRTKLIEENYHLKDRIKNLHADIRRIRSVEIVPEKEW